MKLPCGQRSSLQWYRVLADRQQLRLGKSQRTYVVMHRRLLSVSAQPSLWQRLNNHLNEQSGTNEIDALKRQVSLKSQAFDRSQQLVDEARLALDQNIQKSVAVAARHNELLRTRDRWTTADASLFAETLAEEVTIRDELKTARERVSVCESKLSQSQLEYMDSMRRRYHEEQTWQDKWRVWSTYGTWSLIVLNSCVFLVSQLINQRRELLRIQAIESLITEKFEGAELTVGTAVSSTGTAEEGEEQSEQSAEDVSHDQEECEVVKPSDGNDQISCDIIDLSSSDNKVKCRPKDEWLAKQITSRIDRLRHVDMHSVLFNITRILMNEWHGLWQSFHLSSAIFGSLTATVTILVFSIIKEN